MLNSSNDITNYHRSTIEPGGEADKSIFFARNSKHTHRILQPELLLSHFQQRLEPRVLQIRYRHYKSPLFFTHVDRKVTSGNHRLRRWEETFLPVNHAHHFHTYELINRIVRYIIRNSCIYI